VADKPAPAVDPLPDGSRRARRAAKNDAERAAEAVSRGRRRYGLVSVVSSIRSLGIVFAVSVMVATIFASFTANDALSVQTQQGLAIAQATQEQVAIVPTALPTPVWFKRVGIIPGHSGLNPTSNLPDPGAVCPDGFSEGSVTMKVAQIVIAGLKGRGYTVDQLEEWDSRLVGYDAALFLSIHADSCTNFNDGFPHSGFKAINPENRITVRDADLRLVGCLRDYYSQATGLQFSGWTVTANMYDYHAFHQVTQRTPASIIELGFLYYDRDLLQNHADKAAQGILNGLLCFLDPKSQVTATPQPTVTSPAPPTVAQTLPPITAAVKTAIPGAPTGQPPTAPKVITAAPTVPAKTPTKTG
jgi:N-acetylmuramoyl-L-alanine amidase